VTVQENTATSQDQDLIARLREFVPEAMRATGTPGLNIALARHNEVIWEEGFGYADLTSYAPMTSQTVTRAGSMTKLYTTVAVLQLMELGLVALHDPVQKHLNGIPVVNPRGERDVTVYDLLTFRSGLATDVTDCTIAPPVSLREHIERGYAIGSTIQEYGHTIPRWTAKVGEVYQYSNFGAATLGLLVQERNPDGLSFDEYVKRHVIEPLGMRSTYLPPVQDGTHVPEEVLQRISTGYARFGNVYVPSPTIFPASYPASGLLTIPGDHVKLLLALMAGGRLNGQQILRPDTASLMLTPQMPVNHGNLPTSGDLWWTGLNNIMHNVNREDFHFGYGGGHVWGWWNESRAYPEQDFALVVATNKMDMMLWHNPAIQAAPALISEFVSGYLADPRAGRAEGGSQPYEWKMSYALGLMMIERLAGFLGLDSGIDDAMIQRMVDGTRAWGAELEDSWDPDGFLAAAADLADVRMTVPAIREFMASEALRVPREELKVLSLRLGALEDLPVPLDFWATGA
jgi:CubicO group peptidase (beta-lactamase class C family)